MEKTSEIKGYDGIFATRFREMLKLRGYTQRYVAEQTVSKGQTISQYFNGEVLPNAEKLRDIAQCLNVSADYLLGMSDIAVSNVDDTAINKMLGLSEKAIAALKTAPSAATVNLLLEQSSNVDGTVLEILQEVFAHAPEPDTMFALSRATLGDGENVITEIIPEQSAILSDADVFAVRLLKLQQAITAYKTELDERKANGGK